MYYCCCADAAGIDLMFALRRFYRCCSCCCYWLPTWMSGIMQRRWTLVLDPWLLSCLRRRTPLLLDALLPAFPSKNIDEWRRLYQPSWDDDAQIGDANVGGGVGNATVAEAESARQRRSERNFALASLLCRLPRQKEATLCHHTVL